MKHPSARIIPIDKNSFRGKAIEGKFNGVAIFFLVVAIGWIIFLGRASGCSSNHPNYNYNITKK